VNEPGQPTCKFWNPTPNLGADNPAGWTHRIVVDDLAAATGVFVALGWSWKARRQSSGKRGGSHRWARGVRSDIAMMRTPDGHGRLELTKYHTPSSRDSDHALGEHAPACIGSVAVEDIDDILDRCGTRSRTRRRAGAVREQLPALGYLRGPQASSSRWPTDQVTGRMNGQAPNGAISMHQGDPSAFLTPPTAGTPTHSKWVRPRASSPETSASAARDPRSNYRTSSRDEWRWRTR